MFSLKKNIFRIKNFFMKKIIVNSVKIISVCLLFLISSCIATKDVVKEAEITDVPETYIIARLVGTEPFWTIEIYDEFAYFESPDTKPQEIAIEWKDNREGTTIVSKDAKFPLELHLKEDFCSDGMSDKEYYYAVNGFAQGKAISGCVQWFLNDNYEGTWMLEYAKNIDFSIFENHPYIEWEAGTMQISGNLGCNGIMGRIIYKNVNPSLTYLATTLMWCDEMNIETDLFLLIKSVEHWSVENEKLIGKKGGEVLVKFYKKIG